MWVPVDRSPFGLPVTLCGDTRLVPFAWPLIDLVFRQMSSILWENLAVILSNSWNWSFSLSWIWFWVFLAPWLFQDSRSQCMARTKTCSTQLLIGRYQAHISIASFRFGVLGWLDFLVFHPLLHLKRCNSSMKKHSPSFDGCCWDAQSHVLWRSAVLKACFIVFGGC
jgi:hypothetical protein